MSPEGGGHDVCELPGHFSVALCLQRHLWLRQSKYEPCETGLDHKSYCGGVMSGHVQDVSGS